MGLFAKVTHSGGKWQESEPDSEPCLSIDVHDSDIATVDYRPAANTSGRFFLGTEPRIYFEDESASWPVDRAAEAEGFVQWVQQVHGREVDPDDVLALIASDNPDDEPEDVFVEETVDRLLNLIGLPLPEGMPA